MKKTRQLLIRGCKHSTRRVYSVYRRFYCNNIEPSEEHREIAGILQEICDDLNLINYRLMIGSLHPSSFWFEDTENYWEGVVNILASVIRNSSIDQLPGLTSPLRFRRL